MPPDPGRVRSRAPLRPKNMAAAQPAMLAPTTATSYWGRAGISWHLQSEKAVLRGHRKGLKDWLCGGTMSCSPRSAPPPYKGAAKSITRKPERQRATSSGDRRRDDNRDGGTD